MMTYNDMFEDLVRKDFESYFEKLEPGDVDKTCIENGSVSLINIDIKDIKDFDCDDNSVYPIMMGTFEVECEVILQEYNPNYDNIKDKYTTLGPYVVTYEADFTYLVDRASRVIKECRIDAIRPQ